MRNRNLNWEAELAIPSGIRSLPRVASRITADDTMASELAGHQVLRLEGAPWWSPPQHVLDAAANALDDPGSAPSQGLALLRVSIAEKLSRDNGIEADPESEILVTNAANHALSIVFTALLQPGDEIVVPGPSYQYDPILRLIGAKAVHASSAIESGWRWDLDEVEKAITGRTRILLINTPTNPTGYVAKQDDLERALTIARKHGLPIVSDEAYDNLLFDGNKHISIGSLDPGLHDVITIYSMTKSYAMRGWRVGFVAANRALIAQCRKILEWNCLSVNLVAQHAARAALDGPQAWVSDVGRRFQHCRDLMINVLEDAPGLRFVKPHGAAFLFLGVGELGVTGAEFSRLLLTKFGVPSEGGEYFGDPLSIRLEIGGEDRAVIEASRRVRRAADQLSEVPAGSGSRLDGYER